MERIKKRLVLIVLLVFLIVITGVQAKTFQQNSTIDIIKSIRLNGAVSSNIFANITVYNPDGNAIVEFQPMTYNSNTGTHNYTLLSANTSQTGTYCYDITASGDGENLTNSFCFDINPSGQELTTGQGILYFIIFLFAVFVFCLCLYGSIKIPFRNQRDESGKVIKMNDLKYVKMILWFMTYLIAIWIIALSESITQTFLFFNSASKFFYFLYWILFSFLWPIIVCFFIFSLILFFQDSKFRDALQKGLPMK